MTDLRDAKMPLAELVSAAHALVARVPELAGHEAPDARTVRYYQTLGVVDRPIRYEGRVALYAFRHLLQVVAVRVLQAQGWSLGQIQQSFVGVSTEALEAAVSRALGEAQAPAPPSARALRAAEVAPGIHVTIDPRLVPDPDAAIACITALFSPQGGSR